MADKIRVRVLTQKVFHDGLSMVVLKPGNEKVDPRHLQTLFDEGVIADPGKDALRRAAVASGFSDAGETKGVGDDSFSQPIGAFTEEQERNLAEQSQATAGDEDDEDVIAELRERIAELEGENAEIATLHTRVTELETERDELLAELEEADKQIAELTPAENAADADQTGDDLGALREKYEKLAGKKVFNGWDAETVRAKIAELKADADQTGDEGDAPPA
jgi:hypothetical protein